MKSSSKTKTTLLLTTSALAISATVGFLHAQDDVEREPFFTNDRRLQRPTTGAPQGNDSTSQQDWSESEASLITVDAGTPLTGTAVPPPLTPGQAQEGVPAIGVKTGECYAQVLVEAEMVPVTDRILLREESYELVEIPAQFEEVEERVMVQAGYEKQEVIPATYKTVEERVLKHPAYTRQIPVEPVYETRTAKVMVKPERVYWTEGENPLTELENPTSEIMCLVREPAEYETVTTRVLVQPATTREETVPAEYETYARRVVDTPAQVKVVKIPAVYETRKVRKMVAEARTERRAIPAEYGEVDRLVAQGESRIEWRRVLCETNATPEIIANIQSELKDRGYKVKVNGELDRRTMSALRDFQKDNKLPIAGVSYASLDALGVEA
ncbi:peptidoglycan-binding domain-containing protein [Actomonas aquatica]|uniref:Peptidoglycan binding-like domain-containing protein n=1 Tax=Actomonas aquatica TaxID=2866162 RepID=A0ABZ1CHU8_9BACT|nr:peptidoglycan-binding domain-containing protein [Opitutus sp. WL0086]WRQ89835.1 hypothetical protein K1X11_010500 [Opitutus sp. WL0086]